MDKSSSRTSSLVIKKKRTQIHTVRNEREVIPTPQKYKGLLEITMNNYMKIKWTIQRKMDKFLQMYNLLRPNQEEIQVMNIPIISNEIESVIKSLQQTKVQDQIHHKRF